MMLLLFKELHPINIQLLFLVTLLILNDDKSIEIKEVHKENKPEISVTFYVLNEDNFIFSKDLESENI